jgi:uncharacterized protein YdaU (DUF1376 family)
MADFNKATVALWCSCNGCFALLLSAVWQTSRKQLLRSVLDAVMCCCSEEHLKSTKLVYFAEILNDNFGEVHPYYKMYYDYEREIHRTHGQNYLA